MMYSTNVQYHQYLWYQPLLSSVPRTIHIPSSPLPPHKRFCLQAQVFKSCIMLETHAKVWCLNVLRRWCPDDDMQMSSDNSTLHKLKNALHKLETREVYNFLHVPQLPFWLGGCEGSSGLWRVAVPQESGHNMSTSDSIVVVWLWNSSKKIFL